MTKTGFITSGRDNGMDNGMDNDMDKKDEIPHGGSNRRWNDQEPDWENTKSPWLAVGAGVVILIVVLLLIFFIVGRV